MKIKTYIADNMQEALYKIKSDMGKDAVILQTKHIRKGGLFGLFSKSQVEVVAANDITVSQSPIQKPPLYNAVNESTAPVRPAGFTEILDIKNELVQVKDMIKNLYSNNAKSGLPPETAFSPVLDTFYNKMVAMEIDRELIKNIFGKVTEVLKPEEMQDNDAVFEAIKNEIISQIGKVEPIQLDRGQNEIVAFIGPTGVGKTTTIAKLAAKFALYYGKKVALITTDNFRVGAIEQLRTYGDLLEIPVEVVHDSDGINKALNNVKGYELVLIDTMGSSPNNKMQIKRIKNLLDAINPTDTYMVISATTKNNDISDILNNYREINFKKLIITKLDETKTYGTILNAVKMSNGHLSYFTVGQNVPDDIEIASAEKLACMILGERTHV